MLLVADIVRITAELLGGLSALERTPDLRVLMFHGPLVYLVGSYAGHTPFTEPDIDLFLHHYAPNPALGRQLKEDFLRQAQMDIYPVMTELRWTPNCAGPKVARRRNVAMATHGPKRSASGPRCNASSG